MGALVRFWDLIILYPGNIIKSRWEDLTEEASPWFWSKPASMTPASREHGLPLPPQPWSMPPSRRKFRQCHLMVSMCLSLHFVGRLCPFLYSLCFYVSSNLIRDLWFHLLFKWRHQDGNLSGPTLPNAINSGQILHIFASCVDLPLRRSLCTGST